VNSAILEFNERKRGIERVMELAGLTVGKMQLQQNEKAVKRHIVLRRRSSSEPVKKRRKTLRAGRKN